MNLGRPVVIVDDDVDHALIARVVLGQVAPEAQVEVMTDTRYLLERLEVAPRNALVLVDRHLGGVDGQVLLAALRPRRPDLSLVLLSADLGETERVEALHAGADEAFEKPSNLAGWRVLMLDALHLSPLETSTSSRYAA